MIIGKRGELSSDKVVGWILALIILALAIGIVFFLNPMWYYKLMPQYKIIDVNKDEAITGADVAIAKPCGENGVVVGQLNQGGTISVYFAKKPEPTYIYYKPHSADLGADIVSDADGLGNWHKVGAKDATTQKITIRSEYLVIKDSIGDSAAVWAIPNSMTQWNYGADRIHFVQVLVDWLKLLDGSTYTSGYFCREGNLVNIPLVYIASSGFGLQKNKNGDIDIYNSEQSILGYFRSQGSAVWSVWYYYPGKADVQAGTITENEKINLQDNSLVSGALKGCIFNGKEITSCN